jgi:hypothetical protein
VCDVTAPKRHVHQQRTKPLGIQARVCHVFALKSHVQTARSTLPKNTTGFIAAIAQATCIRKNELTCCSEA